MAWVLETKRGNLSCDESRSFGRDDFPGSTNLSRKHFALTLRESKLYLKDLGSTNGTFFEGQRLKPEQTIRLKSGQTFVAGDLEITCREGAELPVESEEAILAGGNERTLGLLAASTFCALFLMLINGSGMANGRAIGMWNVVSLFAMLAFSVGSITFVIWLFAPKRAWPLKHTAAFGAALLAGSLLMNDALIDVADASFGFREDMAENKIIYHCTFHFNARTCVKEIYFCQRCAQRLPKDMKLAIQAKIKPYLEQAGTSAPSQTPRQPTSILPKVVQ